MPAPLIPSFFGLCSLNPLKFFSKLPNIISPRSHLIPEKKLTSPQIPDIVISLSPKFLLFFQLLPWSLEYVWHFIFSQIPKTVLDLPRSPEFFSVAPLIPWSFWPFSLDPGNPYRGLNNKIAPNPSLIQIFPCSAVTIGHCYLVKIYSYFSLVQTPSMRGVAWT